MPRQLQIICILVGIGVVVFAGVLLLRDPVETNDHRAGDEYLKAGLLVYVENCQSCHGAELQGQLNWQIRKADGRLPAPPHDETGHTWHHPDQVLFAMTKYGPAVMAGQGYESDMPAYDGVLSDEQIMQVLEYIKSTWPEEIRREQARRTQRMEDAS